MSKTGQGKAFKKKSNIFDYYSKDLSTVSSQWNIKIGEPDGKDVNTYLCPISFKIFEKSAIEKGELTLEHVPPESLGGKGIILTAKEINSRHGSANDKKLLQYINTRYFIDGVCSLPVYFSSEECRIKGLKLDLLIDKNEKGLSFSASERHISVLDKMGIFKNWDGSKMKFSGKGFRHPDKSAILKIAYLLAFHRLGYQLILEPKQVVNPSFKKIGNYLAGDLEFQESIPIVGLRDELAPISKGILGVVVSPIDYQCLVVNFSIGIKDKSPYNL